MGRDKRLLRLAGTTLLERNLVFLGDLFPTVALSVRDAAQIPASLPAGVETVTDVVTGSPLAGLASLLTRYREPIFALAADVAFPERATVERVVAAFDGVDVALPIVGDHLEPLHAVYGPACAPHLKRLLDRGAHSLLDLLPEVRVRTVPFSRAEPFFNVNSPDDWEEARRRHRAAEDPADPGPPVVIGVVGRPNSGKTTFIERLIPELVCLGYTVGAIKSVAHFDIDTPGKDSWRHGQAGAEAYAVGSPAQFAFVTARREAMTLAELAEQYFSGYDIVVCEGYRHETTHVIEVVRAAAGYAETNYPPEELLALVTDTDLPHRRRFALDDAAGLAACLVETLGLGRRRP